MNNNVFPDYQKDIIKFFDIHNVEYHIELNPTDRKINNKTLITLNTICHFNHITAVIRNTDTKRIEGYIVCFLSSTQGCGPFWYLRTDKQFMDDYTVDKIPLTQFYSIEDTINFITSSYRDEIIFNTLFLPSKIITLSSIIDRINDIITLMEKDDKTIHFLNDTLPYDNTKIVRISDFNSFTYGTVFTINIQNKRMNLTTMISFYILTMIIKKIKMTGLTSGYTSNTLFISYLKRCIISEVSTFVSFSLGRLFKININYCPKTINAIRSTDISYRRLLVKNDIQI